MSEAELAARLRAEGLAPGSWSNGPGDGYGAHAHGYDKVLVCVRGSIDFGLPRRGQTIRLEVGDRLDLPAGTEHDALVGSAGVTCLEAHRPAGALAPDPVKRAAGSW
ncbi:MAG: Cupin domain protein [Chloroflexi bacterium]|nr:Cupin domain protein [Chloroflexota bacterium]